MHHALLPPDLPPLAQQGQQIGREHGVAIAATLATLDPEQHALAVDVGDLERRDLRHAQAGAIGDRKGGLMLEAGGRVEQPRHLVAAQHHGQVAGMRRPDQLARQVGPIDGLREEEPQRRHDAVHGRRRHAGLALLDLEPAHVIGRRRVRRAPQERGEASDVANVVVLCRSREPAHVHVVDQTLAQWADRSGANGLVHRSAPSWLKKPKCSARSAALLNQSNISRAIYEARRHRSPPAQRVRSSAMRRRSDSNSPAQERTIAFPPTAVLAVACPPTWQGRWALRTWVRANAALIARRWGKHK